MRHCLFCKRNEFEWQNQHIATGFRGASHVTLKTTQVSFATQSSAVSDILAVYSSSAVHEQTSVVAAKATCFCIMQPLTLSLGMSCFCAILSSYLNSGCSCMAITIANAFALDHFGVSEPWKSWLRQPMSSTPCILSLVGCGTAPYQSGDGVRFQ